MSRVQMRLLCILIRFILKELNRQQIFVRHFIMVLKIAPCHMLGFRLDVRKFIKQLLIVIII